MNKEGIAKKINDYFKEYDHYNYIDEVNNKSEDDIIKEISLSFNDISLIEEIKKKLNLYKTESLNKNCLDEADKLSEIISDIQSFEEKNKILILVVEPYKLPYEKTIINNLDSLQKEVDGLIEFVSIDNKIDLICNEEGKINKLPFNRIIGEDIIAGKFLIVENDGMGNIISLDKEELEKYKNLYSQKSINELDEKLVYYGLEKGGFKIC